MASTWALTSRNQFRTPSGAVGEAPDEPGELKQLGQDIDDRLGNGGAETVATIAAMQAIPASRRFLGKLVYVTATDTVYRYCGAGNITPVVSDAPSSAAWLAWSKPLTAFTPSWTNLPLGSTQSNSGLWGISEGFLWAAANYQGAAGTANSSADSTLTLPSPAIAGRGLGQGQYNAGGGSTSNNSQYTLKTQPVGSAFGSTTVLRVRALYYTTTGNQAVRENILGSVTGNGTAGDVLNVDFRGPSAAYA